MRQAWDLVMENYEEVQQLCLDEYQAELNVKRVLSLLLPRVGVEASLMYSNATKEIDGSRFIPTSLRSGTLRVEQPLLNMMLRPSYKSAQLASQAVSQQADYTLTHILFLTSETYLAILQTEALLSVSATQHSLAEQQQAKANKRYENGEAPITDLLQAEEEVNRAERIHLDIRDALRLYHEQLARLLGCETAHLQLTKPDFLQLEQEESLDTLICEGAKRRQDIQSLCSSIESTKFQIKALCRRNWPKLSFLGEYILESPETIALRNNNWSASLWLSMPLFDGGMKRIDVKDARAGLTKAELQYERMLKDLRVELTSTYLEMQAAKRNYALLQTEQNLAQQNYAIMSERYEQGLVANIDLMAAFHNYVEAQANTTTTEYKLTLLKLKLRKEAGFFDDILKECL